MSRFVRGLMRPAAKTELIGGTPLCSGARARCKIVGGLNPSFRWLSLRGWLGDAANAARRGPGNAGGPPPGGPGGAAIVNVFVVIEERSCKIS
jgi:hypothetical protein